MSAYSKKQFLADIHNWLEDKNVLSKARAFLRDEGGGGRDHLNEGKIANWKRPGRGVPETIYEGAALYHSAIVDGVDLNASRRTNVTGNNFYQVFLVDKDCSKDGLNHGCSVYRFWDDVETIDPNQKRMFLTHKTWSTGSNHKSDFVYDLVSKNKMKNSSGHDEDGWISLSERDSKNGSEIAISWSIKEGKNDYGYHVYLDGTVSSRGTNGQKHEYLGGLSVIPVKKQIIIAKIPKNLIKSSSDILDNMGIIVPRCLEFLADGIPIRVLEGFLQGKLTGRHLAPWFNVFSNTEVFNDESVLPSCITDKMEKNEEKVVEEGFVSFMISVDSPAPYLYYSLVFELNQ